MCWSKTIEIEIARLQNVWKLKDYKTFILIHDYNDRNHTILIFFDNLIWSHFLGNSSEDRELFGR